MKYIILLSLISLGNWTLSRAAEIGLGRPLEDLETSVVWPDGRNLPEGSGTVAVGAALYRNRCIACHGSDGRGGIGGELAGGNPDLTADQPDQTIGTYWPHATTLFDFVRRAMPLDAPWSLTTDETYAVVAYLLHINDLWPEDAVLDRAALRQVDMPNKSGFDPIDVDATAQHR